MGYQKFLNWAYSFLASHVSMTCREFIACRREAGEELRKKLLEGKDLTLLDIEASHPGTITDLVQFLQHPAMNGDVLKVIDYVNREFERATGVTEMMSTGQAPRQDRSATETDLRREMLSIRPDDMADRVEDFARRVARKEALLARLAVKAQDVLPLFGEEGARFWQELVESADLTSVMRELDYSVQAGSTRKPNRAAEEASMSEGAQVVLPLLSQWATMTGDVRAINAFLADWCRTRGLDAARYLLPPPPPPAPLPEGGEPGSEDTSTPSAQKKPKPEGSKAQAA